MFEKMLPSLTVTLAVLIAVCATLFPLDKLHGIVMVSRFVETTIPVLAVGALVKYLFGFKS